MRVKEYCVVHEQSKNLFEKRIQALLLVGWQPWQTIIVSRDESYNQDYGLGYIQAMVIYDEPGKANVDSIGE